MDRPQVLDVGVYAPTAFVIRPACLASILSRNLRSVFSATSGSSAVHGGSTSPWTGRSTTVRRPITDASESTWAVRTSGRNWSYGKSVPQQDQVGAVEPGGAAP